MSSTPLVVVGHSGAGAFLPAIGDALPGSPTLVFVDAVVPPVTEPHRTAPGLRDMLDAQTVDGVLRPWFDWWPPEVIAELLPDPADRDALAADAPQLRRSFYDVDVEVPPGWSDRPCGFLRLSDAYEAEAMDAAARGWPVATLESNHLGPHTAPDLVFGAILELLAQMEPADPPAL